MQFDSKEEEYFSWYLNELLGSGHVKYWLHQHETYILAPKETYVYEKHLKTKIKKNESTLLREHVYTPDFLIVWDESARGMFCDSINGLVNLKKIPFTTNEWSQGAAFSVIDIKPSFDRHNMTRLFTINQKWMYQRHNIFVQKIIITGKKTALFQTTFTPDKYLLTDKAKKKRKLNYEPRSLNKFIKS